MNIQMSDEIMTFIDGWDAAEADKPRVPPDDMQAADQTHWFAGWDEFKKQENKDA